MKSYTLFALLAAAAPTFAVLTASTTRYNDGSEGACGCGSGSPFSWQYGISQNVYTAAGSQALFDAEGSTWCGAGCGVCYNLTNLGHSACSTCGTTAGGGESIIVMVTNLCPYGGNVKWCPLVGGQNDYGYSAHFDIMSTGPVEGSWDNPVVAYEQVPCPSQANEDWAQCICHKSGSTTLTSSTTKPPASSTSKTKMLSTTSSTTTPPASSTSKTKILSSTSSSAPSCSPSVKAPLYGQCGGKNWTGPTTCAKGSCVYMNPFYSQCVENQEGGASCLSTPKHSRRHIH